eukprot:15367007-Ditylum_brightwellii.AAC.2
MRGSSANWNHVNVMCHEVQFAYAEMKGLIVFQEKPRVHISCICSNVEVLERMLIQNWCRE